MGSLTEENYIKTIYSLSLEPGEVSVSELAKKLNVKLPTVTSMIKKLSSKKLVSYAPTGESKSQKKEKKKPCPLSGSIASPNFFWLKY